MKVQGVYNYSYATTVAKARSDAKRVLAILGNRKPIIERADIANNEKEIQKQRKAFLAGLMAMQANFELSHPKKEKQT
jgi:hypothetical protein